MLRIDQSGAAAFASRQRRSSSFTAHPATAQRGLPARGSRLTLLLCGCLAASPAAIATAQPTATERTAGAPVMSDPLAGFVAEAAQRFAIPERWIRAVIAIESAAAAQAVSPKGAMGLMQIMPETWSALRQRYGLGADPFDPHDNIIAGTAYLRELCDRYGVPGCLAAYNSGPARYDEHLMTGRPLPAETQAYLAVLTPVVVGDSPGDKILRAAAGSDWATSSLFAAHADRRLAASSAPFAAPRRGLVPTAWQRTSAQPDRLFVPVLSREPGPR
jgi:soluble lytic murein transglycosylase-like protein